MKQSHINEPFREENHVRKIFGQKNVKWLRESMFKQINLLKKIQIMRWQFDAAN